MQWLPLGLSLIRFILTSVGGYLVAKGVIDNDAVSAIQGVVPSVIALVSSVVTHTPVKVTDVASTVSSVAGAVASATKDDQTKDVLTKLKTVLDAYEAEDKAKGNIG